MDDPYIVHELMLWVRIYIDIDILLQLFTSMTFPCTWSGLMRLALEHVYTVLYKGQISMHVCSRMMSFPKPIHRLKGKISIETNQDLGLKPNNDR